MHAKTILHLQLMTLMTITDRKESRQHTHTCCDKRVKTCKRRKIRETLDGECGRCADEDCADEDEEDGRSASYVGPAGKAKTGDYIVMFE
jgi:hypothetical protein